MEQRVTEAGAWTPDTLLEAVRDPARDPIPLLLDALNVADASVRQAAVRYLRELPTPRAVEGLCRLVRSEPDDEVRWEAAEALGLLGDAAAVPCLLAAITDPESMVRLCVAEALGLVGAGDARVAPALCCLLTDVDDSVQIFTLEALGDLGDPIVLPALRTRLDAGLPPDVRVWLYYALNRLGDVPFPLTETIVLLRRGSMRTRTQAARVLARVTTPSTEKRVRRALEAAQARETTDGMRECMTMRLEELDETVAAFR